MRLSELRTGEKGVIVKVLGHGGFRKRIVEMGFIKGKTGAGDAFCAGALIGIYRGLDEMEILTLASKAATASLSAPDSIGGMMSEGEIDKLLKEMNIKI